MTNFKNIKKGKNVREEGPVILGRSGEYGVVYGKTIEKGTNLGIKDLKPGKRYVITSSEGFGPSEVMARYNYSQAKKMAEHLKAEGFDFRIDEY